MLKFVPFLLIPLSYLAFNYYIFCRVNTLFSLNFGVKFKLIGILLGIFSFVFVIWHSHSCRFCHYFAAIWVGASFIAFCVLLLEQILHKFLPFSQRVIAFSSFGLILVLVCYALVNGIFLLKVQNVELKTSKISRDYRAVLLADTHIGRFYSKSYSQKLANKIVAQNPDFVLISGDFLENKVPKDLLLPFENLPMPVFLVLGNHEFYVNGGSEIRKMLEASKIQLVEPARSFSLGEIAISGADYSSAAGFVASPFFAKMNLDSSKYNIFLLHEPKFVDDLQRKGFDLVLSGHTHAGQIFPFGLLVRLVYKYVKGLYSAGKTKVYVSQGTGTWGPPMRLGTRNEITVLDFVRE